MNRNDLIVVLATVILTVAASPCQAVVVFLKGDDKPVVGFFVQQTERSLVIQQVMPDGTRRERVFVRTDVEDVVFTVSRERLEALDPATPTAYRDYAEELAEKRQDPEAQETAMRLYLIAAHLDPAALGRSSLLGLVNLARTEDEQARFRAMAYLLDPEHDERVLQRPNPVTEKPQELTAQTRGRLLDAVRNLRQGRKYSAKEALGFPDIQQAFDQFEGIITLKEFEDSCSRGTLGNPMVRKLILLELALAPGAVEMTATDTEPSLLSWRQSTRRDGLTPVPSLTLERVTEFDPRKSRFQGGRWVVPD
jgi:hypothetical protein